MRNENLSGNEVKWIEECLEGLNPNTFCGGGSWNPRGSDPIRNPLSILVDGRTLEVTKLEQLRDCFAAVEVGVNVDWREQQLEILLIFGKGEVR